MGTIAINEGFLTAVQVEEINALQKKSKEYVTLFYKNIIRFITTEVHISESVKLSEDKRYSRIFEQEIYGAHGYYTAFTGEDAALIPFHTNMGDYVLIIGN